VHLLARVTCGSCLPDLKKIIDATASLADHRSHALTGYPSLCTLGMELRINASAVIDFSRCVGLRAMNLTLWKVSGKLQLSLCSSNSSRCYDAAAAQHIKQFGGTIVYVSGSGITAYTYGRVAAIT